jgi:hypothetical protein
MRVRRLYTPALLLTGIVLGLTISSVAARLRTETLVTIEGRLDELTPEVNAESLATSREGPDEVSEESARLEFVEAWASCDWDGAVGVLVRNAGEVDMSGPAQLELWFMPAGDGPTPEDLPLDVELPALSAGQEMPISVLALWGAGTYSFSGETRPGIPNSDVLTTGDIPFDAGLCVEAANDPGDDQPGENESDGSALIEEPGEVQADESESEDSSSLETEPEDSPGEEPAEENTVEETPTEEAPTDVEGVESTE